MSPDELTAALTRIEGFASVKEYEVSFTDDEPLLAVDRELRAFVDAGPPPEAPVLALAAWLEAHLVDDDHAEAVRAAFTPFLSPEEIRYAVRGLDLPLPATVDVGTAAGFAEAVTATWGPIAMQAAARVVPGRRDRASAAAVIRLVLVVAGVCAVPLDMITTALPTHQAQGVLSLAARAAATLTAIAAEPSTAADIDASQLRRLTGALEGLLRRRQTQIRRLAAELPPAQTTGAANPADEVAGALIQLRALCTELETELADTVYPRHVITTPAQRAGVDPRDPTIVDHRPFLYRMRPLPAALHNDLSHALTHAAHGDQAMWDEADRITLTLGLIHTQLAVLRAAEAPMKASTTSTQAWPKTSPRSSPPSTGSSLWSTRNPSRTLHGRSTPTRQRRSCARTTPGKTSSAPSSAPPRSSP